jgi:competence protein ComEC
MVGGGLWLLLWTARWRLAGLAGIAAGAALAASPELPDVLAGRDGSLVAVRGSDGRLTAAGARGADFELARWLENDGDSRPAADVARAPGPQCDAAGCVMTVKGVVVAVPRHASALDDDCRRARILVLESPVPRGCAGPELVLDFFRLRNEGTHAVYIGADGALTVESVADRRGERPWARRRTLGAPRRPPAAPSRAAPAEQHRDARAPRPEVEDDAAPEEWRED